MIVWFFGFGVIHIFIIYKKIKLTKQAVEENKTMLESKIHSTDYVKLKRHD